MIKLTDTDLRSVSNNRWFRKHMKSVIIGGLLIVVLAWGTAIVSELAGAIVAIVLYSSGLVSVWKAQKRAERAFIKEWRDQEEYLKLLI